MLRKRPTDSCSNQLFLLLMVPGWQIFQHRFKRAKCCWGEELSTHECWAVSWPASGIYINPGHHINSFFPPRVCYLDKSSLRTINYLHPSVQDFHSNLGQQTSRWWVDHIFEHWSKVIFPDGRKKRNPTVCFVTELYMFFSGAAESMHWTSLCLG